MDQLLSRLWWWVWVIPAGLVFSAWLLVVLLWRGPEKALFVAIETVEELEEGKP